MEPNFWHQKWQQGEIAFHQPQPNALLTQHLDILNLPPGSRLFLPLCGKTRDIAWLLSRGYRVVGVELSPIACSQLFEENQLQPQITPAHPFTHYHSDRLEVFSGDFFALTPEMLGSVDAVYDRAALVALPQDLRPRYTAHLTQLSQASPQLLITFEYDQQLLAGPPFSIPRPEVHRHYPSAQLVEERPVAGGLKGKVEARETLWQVPRPQGR